MNLKKLLSEKSLSNKELAAFLDISQRAVSLKINEKTDFTLTEMRKIKKELFPEYDFQFIFETDNEKITNKTELQNKFQA